MRSAALGVHELSMELSQALYKYSAAGKTIVDQQADGSRSPNLAHAVVMCFSPVRGQWGSLAKPPHREIVLGRCRHRLLFSEIDKQGHVSKSSGEADMHRSIEDQIHATYRSLRVGAAVMAFIFPIVLWYGGHDNGLPLRGAMSDYYWATHHVPCAYPQPTPEMPEVSPDCPETKNTEPTPPDAVSPAVTLPAGAMRTWFVGLLFSIGVTLIINQGHSRSENIFLTAAGLLSWCIALFPEQWDKYKHHLTVHIGSAILFFICIAIVSAVFSRNTLSLVKPVRLRKHYQLAYNIIAGFMFLSPVTAMIIGFFGDNSHYTFWAELCGVYAFAIYWCVKTREMSCPGAEKKVIDREFHTPPPLIPGTKPPKEDSA